MAMSTIEEYLWSLRCVLRDANCIFVAAAGATSVQWMIVIHCVFLPFFCNWLSSDVSYESKFGRCIFVLVFVLVTRLQRQFNGSMGKEVLP